jgi:2-phosphoglycerate kinase
VDDPPARAWDVLLIGGASGTGKSTVANELARRFAIPVSPVDDIVTALMALTTPEQQPVLHRFWIEPGAFDWPADRIVEHTLEVVQVLTPGIRAVIEDHLEFAAPVILEGDYLSPALLRPDDERVRAVFIDEPDDATITANLLAREPQAGPQPRRAEVSRRFGDWLRAEALARGVATVDARPWTSLVERVVAALDRSA